MLRDPAQEPWKEVIDELLAAVMSAGSCNLGNHYVMLHRHGFVCEEPNGQNYYVNVPHDWPNYYDLVGQNKEAVARTKINSTKILKEYLTECRNIKNGVSQHFNDNYHRQRSDSSQ